MTALAAFCKAASAVAHLTAAVRFHAPPREVTLASAAIRYNDAVRTDACTSFPERTGAFPLAARRRRGRRSFSSCCWRRRCCADEAIRRRRAPVSTSAPQAIAVKPSAAAASSSGEHRALEREIQVLIKELSDLTRRVNAQIAQVDERSAKLEQLVRAADERAAKLRAMQAMSNGDGGGGSATRASGSALALPAEPSVASPSSDDVIDPRHVEIYTLCEQGLSTQQIAERLHRPSGEVELIIALRPRSHAMGSSQE